MANTTNFDWIECKYDTKIDNVIEKLESAKFDDDVCSDCFGSGKLLWKIELGKEKLNAGTTKKDSADEFSVCACLRLLELEAGESVEAQWKLDYIDQKHRQPSLQPVFKPLLELSKPIIFDDETNRWSRYEVWTKSTLQNLFCFDSTGALTLRVEIRVKNSHRIAYDLAAHVHSHRLAALVICDRPVSENRVEIRAAVESLPLNETSGSNENNGSEEIMEGNAVEIGTDEDSDSGPEEEKDDEGMEDNEPNIDQPVAAEVQEKDDDNGRVENEMPDGGAMAKDDGGLNNKADDDNEKSMDTSNAAEDDSNEISVKSVKVWRSMLVHASPVFETMLKAGLIEGKTGIVVVKNFPYKVVRLFVDYIERGPAAVAGDAETEELPMLVRMAHEYLVKDMYNLGVARMLKTIMLDNVAEYYATARFLRIVDVKKACMMAIKRNWSAEAGTSEFWKSHFGCYGMEVACEAFADYAKLG